MFKFGKNSLDKLATVDERLQTLANGVLKISKVDFGVSYGLRDTETQQKLFARGASQCDGIKKKSKHQDGKAFDFVCYIDGEITWDKKYYYYVCGLLEAKALELGYNITCGWIWSFDDCGHCELV